MIFDSEQFHPCVLCREMVRGHDHICSPSKLGKIEFFPNPPTFPPLPDSSRLDGCQPLRQLTEADVRRIVREEFEALRNGER